MIFLCTKEPNLYPPITKANVLKNMKKAAVIDKTKYMMRWVLES